MQKPDKAFGAEVKPISWGKTYAALAEGQLDSQKNPYYVIYYSKFWNAKQKYITNNEPFLWAGPILMNENFFQSLPTDMQQIVSRAASEPECFEWQWMEHQELTFKKLLIEHGMQIVNLVD